MTTTTRSFFPNHTLIKAAMCCGNSDCDKKEAEAEAEQSLLLNIMCPNCRVLHYCSVDCQKAHSKNHKHQCSKDAQKLKEEKEWFENYRNKANTDNDDDNGDDDESLFRPIPPKEDCHLCALPLSIKLMGNTRKLCCGKLICSSCSEADMLATIERGQRPRCPFCRAPHPLTDDEVVIRLENKMESNDRNAFFLASQYYIKGKYGLPKDPQKVFELSLRAAELGHSGACFNLAVLYQDGVVVAKDLTTARKYYEMAAKKGSINARCNLALDEWEKGNYHTSGRHWLISSAAGDADSLVEIAKCYQRQLVTKEEFTIALTSYGTVHKNEHSVERERAAAAPH